MNYEGEVIKIDINGSTKLMVDAEPHVMHRIRKIFDNSFTYYNRGKFTHKPIIFPITLSSCRDLVWLMERYQLACDKTLLELIASKATEYDDIIRSVSEADKDTTYKISDKALPLALPLREHQVQFTNMFSKMKRMLLADKMGLGKTPSGISVLCEPERRPALVVVPPNLCTQWEREIHKFLPEASTHVIKGFKNYDLPKVDVLITSYNRLSPWQDILLDGNKFTTLIMDEIHEIRHANTEKRRLCKELASRVKFCLGLSGTPIYNKGSEIWSVMDVIRPDSLGSEDEFKSEWCNWEYVYEPATLHSFLKKQGMFLRRTAEDVGMTFGEASKHVYTIDADMNKLREIQNIAKLLAISVLSGNVGEDSESAREFDWRLRHATGVAKAKPVAEFIKMLAEEEEKIVLAGWHRDVYDVWLKDLASLNLVMYTGSESTKEKDEAVKKFVEGDAKVFIISLRSGAGLDGLQKVCNTVVFGELDWSPHVMDQVIARVDRDGQTRHVQAYYLTIPDGADPFMINVLGSKRSQHDGLIDGKQSEDYSISNSTSNKRIKDMATSYLKSIGEEVPEPVSEEGLLGNVASYIRTLKLPNNTEEELQESLHKALLDNNIGTVEREYKLSKRSRLDFLVSDNDERIAIECKIESTQRSAVYRQVRKYIEEGKVTSVIVVAPWHGISTFKVDEVPVVVIDTNINSI